MHCPSMRNGMRPISFARICFWILGAVVKYLLPIATHHNVVFSLVLLMHLGMIQRPERVVQKRTFGRENKAKRFVRASLLPAALKKWHQSGCQKYSKCFPPQPFRASPLKLMVSRRILGLFLFQVKREAQSKSRKLFTSLTTELKAGLS